MKLTLSTVLFITITSQATFAEEVVISPSKQVFLENVGGFVGSGVGASLGALTGSPAIAGSTSFAGAAIGQRVLPSVYQDSLNRTSKMIERHLKDYENTGRIVLPITGPKY